MKRPPPVFRNKLKYQRNCIFQFPITSGDHPMRNRFHYTALNFRRGLLPLALLFVTLSIFSASQLVPGSRAQKTQKVSPAPSAHSASGAPSIVYPETKKV